MNKKCDKKAPKRIHKSEREKLKRDKQNDLFNELGNLLGMCLFRNCESINMIQIAQLHCNIWIFLSEICLFMSFHLVYILSILLETSIYNLVGVVCSYLLLNFKMDITNSLDELLLEI